MHPVKAKLNQSILPYTVSAEKLRWHPPYIAHGLYAYSHEFLVGLAGLGIAPQVLRYFQDGLPENAGKPDLVGTVSGLAGPGWLLWATGAAAILWLVLKAFISQSEGPKRAPMAKSCRRQFRSLGVRINSALAKADPMPHLLKIEDEIAALVDRNIAEDAWPWSGTAPKIDDRVQKVLEELCRKYEQNWPQSPTGQQA